MGYMLPLFQRHPIFDFKDPELVEADLRVLKRYFDTGEDTNVIKLLRRCDGEWDDYLQELLQIRRLELFNSEFPIPGEETKIDEYSRAGNKLAT